jgi:hypothetical protein
VVILPQSPVPERKIADVLAQDASPWVLSRKLENSSNSITPAYLQPIRMANNNGKSSFFWGPYQQAYSLQIETSKHREFFSSSSKASIGINSNLEKQWASQLKFKETTQHNPFDVLLTTSLPRMELHLLNDHEMFLLIETESRHPDCIGSRKRRSGNQPFNRTQFDRQTTKQYDQ